MQNHGQSTESKMEREPPQDDLMFSGQQTSAVSTTRWPAYTFPILALTCFSIPHCWPVHFLVNVTLKPHTHTHTHALMYTEATKHRYTDHCTTFHDLEFCHLHKYPTSRILFPIHVPRMHPSIHTYNSDCVTKTFHSPLCTKNLCPHLTIQCFGKAPLSLLTE